MRSFPRYDVLSSATYNPTSVRFCCGPNDELLLFKLPLARLPKYSIRLVASKPIDQSPASGKIGTPFLEVMSCALAKATADASARDKNSFFIFSFFWFITGKDMARFCLPTNLFFDL